MSDEYRLDLYEYLVEHPNGLLEEAATDLGLTLDDVTSARDGLVGMRLLQPGTSDGTHCAVSPDMAASDRVYDDLARIKEISKSIQGVRSELASVEPRYTAARRRRLKAYTPIELIEDPDAVRNLIWNSTSECSKWAYILHPNPALSAESHRASTVIDLEMLERGIERRNLYHEGILSSAATRRSAAQRS